MTTLNVNVAKDELKRLRKKNATLEGQVSDLRLRNNELKRQNTVLLSKVKGYDKKVERVMERVAKELGTLQQSDEAEDIPVTKKPKNTCRPKQLDASSSVDSTVMFDRGQFQGSGNSGRIDKEEQERTPDNTSHNTSQISGLESIIESRQSLMDMMRTVLDNNPYSSPK